MSDLLNNKIKTKLESFNLVFKDDEACIDLLADLKWKSGFSCSKCSNGNYCKGKSYGARRCTRCKKEESVTANTIFHRCKFSLKKAFEIVILNCQPAAISSYKLSDILDLRHMTCYSFQKKITECQNYIYRHAFERKIKN